MRTILILLLATTIAEAQVIEKNEVDEFTGKHVLYTSFEALDQDGYRGTAKIRVARLEGRNLIFLSVKSREGWQLLDVNTAYFLVDRERMEKELLRIDTEVQSGTTLESYGIFIEDVKRFVEAKDIRFKAGGTVYEFTPEALNSFDIFYEALKTKS